MEKQASTESPSRPTLEHFVRFNLKLEEVVSLEKTLRSLESQTWLPKFYRRTGIPLIWSWVYCFSLSETLALAVHVVGLQEDFLCRLRSEKPYDAIFELVEKFDPDPKSDRHFRRRLIAVLPLLYAMVNSIRAIGYHSQSIDELLARGLGGGEPVMLRNAVAVDPTVLSNPLVADHVSRLQLRGQKKELALLYRAASNGPRKQLQPNAQLRYMERLLSESGAIEQHGREAIFELVTRRLKLYDDRGADPYKALFMSFDRWRKDATT